MKAYVVRQYIKSLDEIPSLLVDAPEPAVAEGEVLIEGSSSPEANGLVSSNTDLSLLQYAHLA